MPNFKSVALASSSINSAQTNKIIEFLYMRLLLQAAARLTNALRSFNKLFEACFKY